MHQARKIWVTANGGGPWPCAGTCGEMVLQLGGPWCPDRGIIHHDDRNHGNNAITNLRAMHHRCHVELHLAARAQTSSRQIAAILRQRIASGDLPPRRAIPPLTRLAAEHNVAMMTVRKALRLLIDEGLIETRPGRGTFVKG